MTVYLSLVFLLTLSFILAILDAAMLQSSKSHVRSSLVFGIESAFAEYQEDLLREYDLFALDGTYEMDTYNEDNVLERILYYGGSNTEMELTRLQLLTDGNHADFLRQTYEYVKVKNGLGWIEDKRNENASWEDNKSDAENSVWESAQNESMIEDLLEEEDMELPGDDPISHISTLKGLSLPDLVLPDEQVLSDKKLEGSNLYNERISNKGKGAVLQSDANEALIKLAFGEYVFDHFGFYGQEKEERPLSYEIEYLLGGEKEDRENLKEVMKKLLLIRFGSNYLFLQTNAEKKAEANALATSLCLLFQSPFAAGLVTQGILLAWAYGESIMDLRSLFDNKKVPLVKNVGSWQLSLSSLLTLGTNEDAGDSKDNETGLGYLEYLKMLLHLEGINKAADNTMTLIEKNMHHKGKTFLLMDQLIVGINIDCVSRLRGGIKYRYKTSFSYNN